VIRVLPHFLDKAVKSWTTHFEDDDVSSLERFSSSFTDSGRFEALLRRDVGGWLRAWPPEGLTHFRVALEWALEHDHKRLTGLLATSYTYFPDDSVALWRGLWEEVFDDPATRRPASDYEIVARDQLEQVERSLFDGEAFIPPAPQWDWLFALEQERAERWLYHQSHELQVFTSVGAFTEVTHDPDLSTRIPAAGYTSLLAARTFSAMGNPGYWRPPASGYITDPYEPLTREYSPVFCSTETVTEVRTVLANRPWPTDDPRLFDELWVGVTESAQGLSISIANGIEAAIERAWELHEERPSPYRQYETWAKFAAVIKLCDDHDYLLRFPSTR